MPHGEWQPVRFGEFGRRLGSSMRTCQITTNAGPAYIKCLGNPEGPHALACEWIGTRLADLMGMQTFDFALFTLTGEDVPFTGGREEPGAAFVTREEDGDPWSGDPRILAQLINPQDIAKLVVLDTWLLNRDRHTREATAPNRDNVFLSRDRSEQGPCLVAMDFTHAISFGREIDVELRRANLARDEAIYGLFDDFCPYVSTEYARDAIQSMEGVTDTMIEEVLGELPQEWQVDRPCRAALRTFLSARRDYLVETLFDRLSVAAGAQTHTEDQP